MTVLYIIARKKKINLNADKFVTLGVDIWQRKIHFVLIFFLSSATANKNSRKKVKYSILMTNFFTSDEDCF